MESSATTASIWPVILPVIVGGLLALMGTLAGPAATQWLANRRAQQQHRIERFEEMLAQVYAFDHWLDRKRNERLFDGAEVNESSPIHRATAIAALYFPDFIVELHKVEAAADQYEMWMLKAVQKRLNREFSTINDGLESAITPYRAAFAAFQTSAQAYAAKRGGKV